MNSIQLNIDGLTVMAKPGATVLEAARSQGVHIPTLCHLERVQSIGACRICLVEVEGARTLAPSCVTPVSAGMKVRTNSPRVRDARRMIIELLLSDHHGDCLTCDRSGDCELQALAREYAVREVRFQGEKSRRFIDTSTPALARDTGKCVLCRRCVAVCSEIQKVGAIFPQRRGFDTVVGPAFDLNLQDTVCVQCGQCAAVCPVGAIIERDQVDEVFAALDDPGLHVVVQTAPAIRAALGECFGFEPGTLVTGRMVSALRRLGFDAVFDTNFSADLTIIEEGSELLMRLKKALVEKKEVALPMFTSCSPGWIKFLEHFYPDMRAHVSTCKSPQQMLGALAKTYYADKIGKRAEEIFVVSVMPCTAKKYEAQRPEMNASGVQDVDVVLTTRELGRMIRNAGIDFAALPEDSMDPPLGLSSGAADIFANTGGVMEAALRTVHELITGRPLPFPNLNVQPISGLKGVKEATIGIRGTVPEWSFLEGVELNIAVAHGLGNVQSLLERIRSGEASYHFAEFMTCPGGCIGGGGQPRITTDAVREARIRAICDEDLSKKLRMSHKNPDITKIYQDYLGEPLGKRSHRLLHTKYEERQRV